MTEHFVPLELFDMFSRECFGDNVELAKEARSAHMLAVKAIEKNQAKIMLYNRALVDFVLSGELDFFNNKITLSPEQRKKTLIHIRRLFEGIDDYKIKLINDGFSDDFKYITNPCMFLSHSLDYLRLENRQYKDNLMLIKNEATRNIFNVFFEKIWNYDQNVVSSDIGGIINKLDNLIETSELLAGVKKDIE